MSYLDKIEHPPNPDDEPVIGPGIGGLFNFLACVIMCTVIVCMGIRFSSAEYKQHKADQRVEQKMQVYRDEQRIIREDRIYRCEQLLIGVGRTWEYAKMKCNKP